MSRTRTKQPLCYICFKTSQSTLWISSIDQEDIPADSFSKRADNQETILNPGQPTNLWRVDDSKRSWIANHQKASPQKTKKNLPPAQEKQIPTQKIRHRRQRQATTTTLTQTLQTTSTTIRKSSATSRRIYFSRRTQEPMENQAPALPSRQSRPTCSLAPSARKTSKQQKRS